MKILILFITLLLVAASPASSQVFGKKKSPEAPAADPKIDSLTQANQALTLKADSLSKELAKYAGLYAVIKDKVIHYDFDPEKMSFLIDSLKGSKDAAAVALVANKQGLPSDSISALLKQTTMIRTNLDSVKLTLAKIRSSIPAEDRDKVKAVVSLKQYKDLLDAKVITDEEYLILKKKCLSDL